MCGCAPRCSLSCECSCHNGRGLGGEPGVGYFTVQMSANAPGGVHCIHLGKYKHDGGLGDNICGNSRHGRNPETGDRYGFSCSGGSTDPDAFPCAGCLAHLRHNPGRVGGMFANLFDPKPDEPTGLGAVVEDTDGRRWVNSHRITAWVHQDLQPRKYDEIAVVRVLSEGVPSC